MADFVQAVDVLLAHEGGYVFDAADPGGETNFGISKRSYPDLDIKALTVDDAKAIYERDWWGRLGELNSQAVATKALDLMVNMGRAQGTKILQQACIDCGTSVVADGKLGSLTLAAANATDEGVLLEAIRMRAKAYYYALVAANPKLSKFLHGWLNRADS